MWLLTRYELLAPLSARHTPQLFRLLLPGEEVYISLYLPYTSQLFRLLLPGEEVYLSLYLPCISQLFRLLPGEEAAAPLGEMYGRYREI